MTFALCVFCGSAPGARPEYAAAAREVGAELGRRGWTLVYGGGRVGLMGVLADAAVAAGASVVGVIPRFLFLLNVAGYYDALLGFIDTMVREQLLYAESRALLDTDTSVTRLLDRLVERRPRPA